MPKQPYTDQANLGFAKRLGKGYAVEIEGVYAKGHDLGTRPALNVRINGGPRRFAGVLPLMGTASWRVDLMGGESVYKGINFVAKKRWDGKLQLLASYTLSEAKSSASLRATDEFGDYNVLNAFDPWNERQLNPTRTDARHRVQFSGTWSPGWGLNISPIFRYRSKTPYNVITGFDDNRDGATNDIPSTVETQNAARGSDFSQLDLRIAKKFSLGSRSPHRADRRDVQRVQRDEPRRLHGQHALGELRPADDLRRRLPARRAARRPAGAAARVLADSLP